MLEEIYILKVDKEKIKRVQEASLDKSSNSGYKIENVKYIDLNKVSNNEKNIALRYIFICPILALLLTLIFCYKFFCKT